MRNLRLRRKPAGLFTNSCAKGSFGVSNIQCLRCRLNRMYHGVSTMKVIIMRHGQVDFKWKAWSTSEEFNEDCKMYDEAPVFPLLSGSSQIKGQDIYISSLQRSRETAGQLFGERDFISTGLIDEVPLCASAISNIRLPLIFWNISGRLQWLFDNRAQKECRRETVYRAEEFIEILIGKGKDCTVVTHGFFMHTLISCMKKQMFQVSRIRFRYSNGECITAEL